MRLSELIDSAVKQDELRHTREPDGSEPDNRTPE
jgi:hypothetical protein